jgi:pilus assembly protein CpaF
MSLNTILMIASAGAVLAVVLVMYAKARRSAIILEEDELNTMPKIIEHIKQAMLEIDNDDYGVGLSETEFDRAYRRKARVREALANCVHGIESAKIIVIDLIRNQLADDVLLEHAIRLVGADSAPTSHTMFEILMYRGKKRYGKNALAKLIHQHDFARERESGAYYISADDIVYAYARECELHGELTTEETYDMLAILVYQRYKGFGIIDTIREMDIDGINLGTSGALLPQVKKEVAPEFRVENSIWIFCDGKQIHMRFLSLETEDELRRIVLSLIRYGSKGSLTQNIGKVVSTAPDKARITALCPPASESWAVFVRKFGFTGKTPEELLIKDYTRNGDLAIGLIKHLMNSMVTCMITGQQGTGKTTLMTSIIRYFDPRYTIRTLELAFELYLRNLYPDRNILAVQETPHVSASELQDVLKKTDGAITVIGEVATDEVAARFIQNGQVASRVSLGTHHAKTTVDLVLAFRNSLANVGNFSNMDIAERQVIDVIKVDIHLDVTADGKRYIDRVTEIVPLPPGQPYPDYIEGEPESMNLVTREYYTRQTDRRSFEVRDILKYDLATHTYKIQNWFSKELSDYMLKNLESDKQGELREFAEKWGKNLL